MIWKGIQYFRYSETTADAREVMFASLLMAHEELKKFCDDVELWVDEEGMKIVSALPVSWSALRLLPPAGGPNFVDKAIIMAAQDRPFILFNQYVFVLTQLTEEKTDRDVFVYARTKNAGTEYVYDTNIRRLIDVGIAGTGISDWQTEKDINAAILGGLNYSFWKAYGLFVQGCLLSNPKMIELQPDNFQYFVDSWLLKIFSRQEKITIDVLETDHKRISEVRAPSMLMKLHMPLPVVIVQSSMLSFIDIQEFILSLFRVRHLSLWKRFREVFPAPKREQQRSIDQLPSFELSSYKDLADDALLYENRRARMLNKIIEQNTFPNSTSNNEHQLFLDEFRTSNSIIITTSELTDVVKTKWDWRHHIRSKDLTRLKWLANKVSPTGNYTTLMSSKFVLGDVVENNIDDLNETILEVFTVSSTLRDGIEKIKNYFDEADSNQLFDAVSLRIYDLYMLGALQVTHND